MSADANEMLAVLAAQWGAGSGLYDGHVLAEVPDDPNARVRALAELRELIAPYGWGVAGFTAIDGETWARLAAAPAGWGVAEPTPERMSESELRQAE